MCLVLVCLSFLTQSHMLQVQPSLPNSKIIHGRICIWNTDKLHRREAGPEIDRALESGHVMMRTVWTVDRRCSALPVQLWAFLGNMHVQVWTLSCTLPCETHRAAAMGCVKAEVFPGGECKYSLSAQLYIADWWHNIFNSRSQCVLSESCLSFALSNPETSKFIRASLPISADSLVSTDENITCDYSDCFKPRNSPFCPLV